MSERVDKKGIHTIFEVFGVSLKLGLTSFGGPIAHLAYFQDEYVRRRQWLDERSYADLVALCQFLPGPASSQVGIGIGTLRAGVLGGLVAWLGFTLPSVIALVAFAYLLQGFDMGQADWVHGLKIVAVAIVAQAIISMGQKLTPDRSRITIAIATAALSLMWPTALLQIVLIAASAVAGLWLYRTAERKASVPVDLQMPINKKTGAVFMLMFFVLLIGLPILRGVTAHHLLDVFDSFYRSGALVFGGGHVVLPLLERETVATGWISKEAFLAGYGAAQAVPGPLFTFASYLGAMNGGIRGALVATAAIFLPAFLLVLGALPFWNALRRSPSVQGALMGVNAAVVGILLAAFYNPIWTSAVLSSADFALAAILFAMLYYWKLPPWVIVMIGALGGTGLHVLFH
ncbi:chromate transporter [Paenibacillus aestuarii]|uniref:Chromate transporter n=1 Tax=Paenibacillus aestuarii TaxID=516965 RepID=A0ABW0K4I8_9BACL|nr:chromate transporter [Paenibacillus aestuarii]